MGRSEGEREKREGEKRELDRERKRKETGYKKITAVYLNNE